jgi:hypothetical protein
MKTLKLLLLTFLFSCSCEEEKVNKEMIINPYIYGAPLLASDDFIPVIFSWGQSNEIGRGEAERQLQLTPYSFDPTGIKIYYKTNYSATDNGAWYNLQTGSVLTQEPDNSVTTFGSYITAAIKLGAILNKTVYIIPTADGGTVVNNTGGLRTWHPSVVNECFDVAMDNYYQVAIDKLQVAFPGKQIVVFMTVTEGESDAGTGRTQLQFYNDITTVISSMRAYELLSTSPLIAAKMNYLQTSAEDDIDAAWVDYYNANPSVVRLVETTDLPRKMDLTTAQKGGITASTGSDDEHLSYIAQNTKGLRVAEEIRNYYGWADVSIIPSSTNTGFDPTTLGTVNVRLQGTSSKVTLQTDKYNISTSAGAIVNDGSTGTFAVTGTIQYKETELKGWINISGLIGGIANTSRIQTGAAVGTSLFNHSFSIAAWIKPRDGNPPANYSIFHDIASTGTPNNSRLLVYMSTDGKLNALYAVGGTAVTATTASAIFVDGTQDRSKHIAITFTSGNFIRIYVDGVLQTLDVTNNGNIAALTMANYTNGTNVFTIGAQRTGAATYNTYYYGHIREVMIQPVVYSAGDIANLMLN